MANRTPGMKMMPSPFATNTLKDILRDAPRETTTAGDTRQDAIIGPTLEVFLHEVGHAVFDYLAVPVLGREEDAADPVLQAYILLQFADSDALQTDLRRGYLLQY